MIIGITGGDGFIGYHTYTYIKYATDYHRERNCKREFKGGSPLYPGKGSTTVTREGLMKSLKKKFGKDVKNQSILNEDAILDE